MRKKKHPEHVNHERWLVSYADFITLLFAFFVVMFAVSQVDSKKVGRFTEAFSKAVGISVFPLPGDGLLTGGPEADGEPQTGNKLSDLDGLQDALDKLSQRSSELQGLQILKRRNELVLRLPEGVLFDTGEARVNGTRMPTLKAIAPELQRRNVEVRVEGYTDDRPISTGRFRSNWELSTARAIAVMTILVGEGMEPNRVSVAGYGEFRPLATNKSEDGRKQNRRVDLVVSAILPPEEGQP